MLHIPCIGASADDIPTFIFMFGVVFGCPCPTDSFTRPRRTVQVKPRYLHITAIRHSNSRYVLILSTTKGRSRPRRAVASTASVRSKEDPNTGSGAAWAVGGQRGH